MYTKETTKKFLYIKIDTGSLLVPEQHLVLCGKTNRWMPRLDVEPQPDNQHK